MGAWDDLAAGDEVRGVQDQLHTISEQLERMGGGQSTSRPLGHISVPKQGPQISIPKGRTTIDFNDGIIEHEEAGRLATDLVTISDLSKQYENEEAQLRSLITHVDTAAEWYVGSGQNQSVNLDFVPLPQRDFATVTIDAEYPGRMVALASTEQLPIGLGGLSIYAARYGEATGILDTYTAVPVGPHDKWNQSDAEWSNDRVFTAPFDSTTWTVENTSGNGNTLKAEIQAYDDPTASGTGTWRTIAESTGIADGDYAILNIWQERHTFMRAVVGNESAGLTVSAAVDMMEASP